MRLLDKVFLTKVEEYRPYSIAAEVIETWLEELNLNAKDERYVIRVTVDRVEELASFLKGT